MQTIEIAGRSTPPEWALRQRRLMAERDRAAPRFGAKYTRADGTFIWRDGYFSIESTGILVRECDVPQMWLRFLILFLLKPFANFIAQQAII